MAMMGAMSAIGTIVSAVGTVVGMAGQMAAGQQAKAAAEYQAKQHEVAAKEEAAAAQRDAEALERKKELALSTLQTNAAASGFSATDPTALSLAGDIERYGTVQEQMAMYGGLSRREGQLNSAAAARLSGQAAAQGARYRAIGTALSGIGSIADRFNPTRQAGAATSSSSPYFYGAGGGYG